MWSSSTGDPTNPSPYSDPADPTHPSHFPPAPSASRPYHSILLRRAFHPTLSCPNYPATKASPDEPTGPSIRPPIGTVRLEHSGPSHMDYFTQLVPLTMGNVSLKGVKMGGNRWYPDWGQVSITQKSGSPARYYYKIFTGFE